MAIRITLLLCRSRSECVHMCICICGSFLSIYAIYIQTYMAIDLSIKDLPATK